MKQRIKQLYFGLKRRREVVRVSIPAEPEGQARPIFIVGLYH